ncbi:cytochrome P450 [Lasiosphaeria miniovina]|uniref:Cytochrome P450 n=1 Tax=Lasiosphaeria miniovina TaxID=1954250 RepID=A0AA40A683_9PEZI|nr:cytochrome P450 [Lasiosphaeria miniovina]KAK0710024.1 cytochrome P450 [Lasiosphaeria miniovina]
MALAVNSPAFSSLVVEPRQYYIAAVFIVVAAILIHHTWSTIHYRRARRREAAAEPGGEQLPPAYPAFIPYVGNIASFVIDTGKFIRQATLYHGRLTSSKITLLGRHLYIFQERETISRIMRHQDLSSPMSLYNFGLRYLFGMPKAGLVPYADDDSGLSAKPLPGSNVAPEKRIDHLLHRAYHKAWTGSNLDAASRRFTHMITAQLLYDPAEIIPGGAWTQLDDMFSYFGKAVSTALIQTIFGPALLQLNPGFVDDLWVFDDGLPWLVRKVPSFLVPGPYRVRSRLQAQIRRWYAYSRQWFREDSIGSVADGGGDADPFWGSEIIRHLHREMLIKTKSGGDRGNKSGGFMDSESLSAHDLGMLWGSVSNSISATMMMASHIFRDPVLLQRVRSELEEQHDFSLDSPETETTIDFKRLWKLPLLCSCYAETLRLHVEVLLMFSSPHSDVSLGKWRLPRTKIALVNTVIAHMDEAVWNTKGGLYPLNTFWADRFIVDPADPSSGPVRPECKPIIRKKPWFSTDGLDGSWIPYGGGPSMCPGRFLSKTVILSTVAILVTKFDMDILTDQVVRDTWRFGLGVARPKGKIPARVRRREAGENPR